MNEQATQERTIPLTLEQVRTIIGRAYQLSRPQGLGWLHHTEGDLDPQEVEEMIQGASERERDTLHMDYVHGRAVKLTIWRNGDSWFLRDDCIPGRRWYDHSDSAWEALLEGIEH